MANKGCPSGQPFLLMEVRTVLPAISIETPRLLLREPRASDLDAVADSLADAEVMAHLGGVQSRPQAWRTFAGQIGGWVLRGYGMFSVFEKTTGDWIGRIGPNHPEGWPGQEIGWAVTTEAQGRGLAFEAAAACMDFAFEELGWPEVIHCIEDANERSVALARRLGSEPLREATLPPPLSSVTVRVWGQTREAWRAARGARVTWSPRRSTRA